MRACCLLLLLAALTAMQGTDGDTFVDQEDGENDEYLADSNSVNNSIETDLDLTRRKKKPRFKLKPSKGKGKRGKRKGKGNGKGKGKGKGKRGKGSEFKWKLQNCPIILRSGKKETLILKYIFDPDCPPPRCSYTSPPPPLSNDTISKLPMEAVICRSDIPNATRCSDKTGNLCHKKNKLTGSCSYVCRDIQKECDEGIVAPGVCQPFLAPPFLWCHPPYYTCCRNGVYETNYNCNLFYTNFVYGGYCEGNNLRLYNKDCCTLLQQTCSLDQSRCLENCSGMCPNPCSCPKTDTCPAYNEYPTCFGPGYTPC